MSLHVYGSIVTCPGIAANNRGENEGNISTLQKILWKGQVHTTVSSEAIRWAVRYYWQQSGIPVNRVWVEEKQDHAWNDPEWLAWLDPNGKGKEKSRYIDDDLLGFMSAHAAKIDGSDEKEGSSKKKSKGGCDKRRGVLEVARAISLTPFTGDITFNAKSGEKGNTSLYGTEVHATRYQFSFAMTPGAMMDPLRAIAALEAFENLGEVAGNHSRFLYDFSPESVILRVTEDPAPRILYVFEQTPDGKVTADELVRRIRTKDIPAEEITVGGLLAEEPSVRALVGENGKPGVKEAFKSFKEILSARLKEE